MRAVNAEQKLVIHIRWSLMCSIKLQEVFGGASFVGR
jgi:hypothetical protein